jgi:glutamyl-tRNA reductase
MGEMQRVDIPLVLVGCDFRSANVSFREQLVSTATERQELHQQLTSIEPEAGLVVLETCNRVEWIVSSENPQWIAELLSARMLRRWQQAFPDVAQRPLPCVYTGRQAARHVLRVVAGLESLAAGEAQIAGQVQDALNRAREEGMSTAVLNSLAKHAGRVARAGTQLGFRSGRHHGIHGITARFLMERVLGNRPQACIAVAGMGAIGRRTADTLEEQYGCRVIRTNRTVAEQHTGRWHPLAELPELLAEADALVVATGALKPVLAVEQFAGLNGGAPLPVVDIGIPRQVAPEAQRLPGVAYHSLDDLVEFHAGGQSDDRELPMRQEVKKELELFKRYCIERNLVALLADTQRRREEYIQQQIPALVSEQFGGLSAEDRRQLEQTMRQLISQFSHDSFTTIHSVIERHWSEM